MKMCKKAPRLAPLTSLSDVNLSRFRFLLKVNLDLYAFSIPLVHLILESF